MTTSREKWIESESSVLLSELARQAIAERLELVQRHLPLAAKRQGAAVEDVHQLRVATRRATSALNVFRELASRKQVRHMRDALRQIRRAAGEARDLDVLYLRLAPTLVARHDRAAIQFLELLLADREAAQRPLVKLHRHFKNHPLENRLQRLLRTIRWRDADDEPTMSQAAHDRLVPLIHQFYAAAGRDLSDPEMLHKMRIAGKHLRYALELFAGAYDGTLREVVYPFFIEIQDRLGWINDYATSQKRLSAWQRKAKGPLRRFLEELVDEEHSHGDEQWQVFHQWWTPERARDMQDRFRRLLRQNTPHPLLNVVSD